MSVTEADDITPVVEKEVTILEFNAAQALLNFRKNVQATNEDNVKYGKEEVEETNPSVNSKSPDVEEPVQGTATNTETNEPNEENEDDVTVDTQNVGTQTDDLDEFPPLKKKKINLDKFYDIIRVLEKPWNSMLRFSYGEDDDSNDETTDDKPDKDKKTDEALTKNEKNTTVKNKAFGSGDVGNSRQVLTNNNIQTELDDMVPIGEGKAKVPARILRHMNWSSYTIATRKLLMAVFPRRVLATHCLTGRRSAAFPMKPPKKQLDTELVNDIVQTVVEHCGVTESDVRLSITTKCADEAKMFRNRQNKKTGTWQENIPSE